MSKQQATFAGGCFWCVQGPFDAMEGVSNVEVGYAGEGAAGADYYAVAGGKLKLRESVHMEYDPEVADYEEMVRTFFRQIDPTDDGGQFYDRGYQYTTAVYYHTDEQREIIEKVIADINASGKFDKPVATKVEPFAEFSAAGEEHQQYYKKNPLRYGMYKKGSGRADYIKKNWE